MQMLPPIDGTCPVCAVKHGDIEAHNVESLYYQYRFYGLHNRWPTWADAIAHCPPHHRAIWQVELKKRDAWTEPASGQPIGEPPAESIAMVVDIFNNQNQKAKDT